MLEADPLGAELFLENIYLIPLLPAVGAAIMFFVRAAGRSRR